MKFKYYDLVIDTNTISPEEMNLMCHEEYRKHNPEPNIMKPGDFKFKMKNIKKFYNNHF